MASAKQSPHSSQNGGSSGSSSGGGGRPGRGSGGGPSPMGFGKSCQHELAPQDAPPGSEISLNRCLARQAEMAKGKDRFRRFVKPDWAGGPADDWGWGYVWGYRRAQYHIMKHLERSVFSGFMCHYDRQRQRQREQQQQQQQRRPTTPISSAIHSSNPTPPPSPLATKPATVMGPMAAAGQAPKSKPPGDGGSTRPARATK